MAGRGWADVVGTSEPSQKLACARAPSLLIDKLLLSITLKATGCDGAFVIRAEVTILGSKPRSFSLARVNSQYWRLAGEEEEDAVDRMSQPCNSAR